MRVQPTIPIIANAFAKALLPSLLLALTVYLTTPRSASDILTIVLHYPLFLLVSVVLTQCIPAKWIRFVNMSVASLLVAELALISLATG